MEAIHEWKLVGSSFFFKMCKLGRLDLTSVNSDRGTLRAGKAGSREIQESDG